MEAKAIPKSLIILIIVFKNEGIILKSNFAAQLDIFNDLPIGM